MNKGWIAGMLGIGLGLSILSCQTGRQTTSAIPTTLPTPEPAPDANIQPRYQRYVLSHSTVHLLVIPAQSRFRVVPALSERVDPVEDLAQQQTAIAAINSGFFDPSNQKTTATVILQGKQVADPRQNEQLIKNPDLVPYLPQILNRSEFRRYQCGANSRYAIARRQSPVPAGCQLVEAQGGGPQLLPQITARTEGFWDERTGRDPIGVERPNARTAIGIRSNGDVLWVIAAQKPGVEESGLSLRELATFLRSQGAVSALNLDGGSSTAFYYQGKTMYGKFNEQGEPISRPVKSVLLLVPTHPASNSNNASR